MGAGLIHASVIGSHLREYWLFGVLFAIVAPLQLLWAELVRRHPRRTRLLLAGAAANAGLAAVWAVSRTAGLPLGPHAGEPEAAGLRDVLATVDELLLVATVALALRRPSAAWVVPGAWALAGLSVLAAVIPGGSGHARGPGRAVLDRCPMENGSRAWAPCGPVARHTSSTKLGPARRTDLPKGLADIVHQL